MDSSDRDDLPPDLDDIARRMRAARPVADDRTLDRVMARAQATEPAQKRSLLWQGSGRRRSPRRTLAAGLIAIVATLGVTGAATAGTFKFTFVPSVLSTIGVAKKPAPPAPKAAPVSANAAAAVYLDCTKVPKWQATVALDQVALALMLSFPPFLQDPQKIAKLQAEITLLQQQIAICAGNA